MRHCWSAWLLALCLVSVQLLVAAQNLSPPALTPPLVKEVDDLVDHVWTSCGLDRGSLEDVRKHFNYNHVFDILRTLSGKDTKDSSPETENESAKNLPIDYIKMLIAMLRSDVAQGPPGASATPAPPPAVKSNPSLGEPSSTKPDKNPVPPSETTPKEKTVPQTEKTAAKKEDNSGMPTTALIGLSVSAIALLALLCLCCCVCRAKQGSSSDVRDDKLLVNLNLSNLSAASLKFSQGNPIDINKLGALPLKSEAGQNGNVKQSSSEISKTEVTPAVYNSLAEPMAASTGSFPGSRPTAPPAVPPPAPAPPKAPPSSTPQAPAPLKAPPSSTQVPAPLKAPPSSTPQAPTPHSKPTPILHPESSSPSAPKAAPSPIDAPQPKAAPPPPPPKSTGPPPPAMPGSSKTRPPPLMKKSGNKMDDGANSHEAKTKLKPFFWDKVTAHANQSMVWDHLKSGSFQFNEGKMESLFGYNSVDKTGGDGKKDLLSKDVPQFVRILDPKKAQNLAISLRALSVSPEEVCSAVKEGNELPPDLIDTLLKWTPSNDEELRLRLYTGELSQLGPAEQFLKAIIDIPYIFQRLDALLFMSNLPEEASNVKHSFATLEVACQELKNSRLFLKLLEAVLKTGNRMNVGTFRGGAQAFKLDTLLKLSDVKGTDGKTTLLHFVVQEIIRSEGIRATRAAKKQDCSVSSVDANDTDGNNMQTEDDYKQLGLKVVSNLGDELQNVRKAAILDADQLTMSVASLGHKLGKTKEFLNTSMKSLDEDSRFHHKLKHFAEQSQTDVALLLEEEKKIRSLVRGTVDYFHGSTGKDEGLRLFVVVRDFLAMLEKVCKEVKEASKVAPKKTKTPQPPQASFNDPRRKLFPAIQDQRTDSSSSSSDEDD
ncbi:formin-like protein 11 isoform X2 [Sorghum bicolor]|uniref:formin-like protein 11 isoform X2 n=1 Tax=Sorghum bicolor TaxID=4558 RepID=UPI000B42623C|nr:formin-like protein 11 isoform X2 [Sorghum bicolor]|eukprot:XP_021309320.1 formin-like protein 11 isoform X2 [Sorghum bicolor]